MNFAKKLFAPVDMTEGKPWEKIIIFAVPMLIGNVAQQMYSTVDSIVVGRYIGDNALAAVGSAAPIVNLLIFLFVGISMGASVMAAQYLGAKQRKELSRTVGNCVILTGIASLIVMIGASLLSGPLLRVLKTPESIIDWSHSYLLILFIGSAGMAYYNILSGILRGLGDSISALIYLIICCIVNVFLDIYFVKELGLGVNGVAIATVIAQAISGLLCYLRLCRMTDMFDMGLKYMKLDAKCVKDIIRLGLPSGLTQAIFSVAMVIVQALTNSLGEQFIAANVILQRVDGFAMLPNFTFGTALTTYAGQNMGAGLPERTKKGAKQGTLIAMITSAAITIVILIFGKYLMEIFTNTRELVEMSMRLMRILSLGYVAMAVTQSLSGIMRGAGDTITPMWISLIITVIIRVPLAYIMVYLSKSVEYPNGRGEFIFISLLITWIIGATLTAVIYKTGIWKKMLII